MVEEERRAVEEVKKKKGISLAVWKATCLICKQQSFHTEKQGEAAGMKEGERGRVRARRGGGRMGERGGGRKGERGGGRKGESGGVMGILVRVENWSGWKIGPAGPVLHVKWSGRTDILMEKWSGAENIGPAIYLWTVWSLVCVYQLRKCVCPFLAMCGATAAGSGLTGSAVIRVARVLYGGVNCTKKLVSQSHAMPPYRRPTYASG